MARVLRYSTRSVVTLTLAALLVVVAGTRAQVVIGTPKDDKPLPIDAAGRAKAIEAILKELEERYVFPDTAKKMRQAIEARIERKEYDGVDTGQELAKKLTAHLQEVSKDKHLRVMCHLGKLPGPPKGDKSAPKDLERMRQGSRKLNGGYRRGARPPGESWYLPVGGGMGPQRAARPAPPARHILAPPRAPIRLTRRPTRVP